MTPQIYLSAVLFVFFITILLRVRTLGYTGFWRVLTVAIGMVIVATSVYYVWHI